MKNSIFFRKKKLNIIVLLKTKKKTLISYFYISSPSLNNYSSSYFRLCPCKFLYLHNYKFTNIILWFVLLVIKTKKTSKKFLKTRLPLLELPCSSFSCLNCSCSSFTCYCCPCLSSSCSSSTCLVVLAL